MHGMHLPCVKNNSGMFQLDGYLCIMNREACVVRSLRCDSTRVKQLDAMQRRPVKDGTSEHAV